MESSKAQTSKVGWAVVGLGQLSIDEILPAFAQCQSSRLVALVSGTRDKALALGARYGVPESGVYTYDDFDRIADNPDIGVVYNVLPNSLHAEYTIRAFQAGKHVLCEKPLAPTVAECKGMISTAKQCGKKLMTAYRLHYEPFNLKMMSLAREKAFGSTRVIVADHLQDVTAPDIRLSKDLWGGPLGDVGVYCINACRYLTGEEPLEVNAMLTRPDGDPRFNEVEDRIVFQLRFPSGILANCSAGFSAHVARRFTVFAEKGSFGLDPAFGYSNLKAFIDTPEGRQELRIESVNQFSKEMDHFSECILSGSEPRTSGEDGARDVHLINCIYKAAEEKRTVLVDEIF